MIEKALETARKCHRGQIRSGRNGLGTYFGEHVFRVYELILEEEGIKDEAILVVSLLHDVVEDTDYTDRLFENGGHIEYIVKFADRLQNLRCMKYKNDKKWIEKKLMETEMDILPRTEDGIKKIKTSTDIDEEMKNRLIDSINSMSKKIRYETDKNWEYIK